MTATKTTYAVRIKGVEISTHRTFAAAYKAALKRLQKAKTELHGVKPEDAAVACVFRA